MRPLSKRVLIAEDDMIISMVLQKKIKKMNHQVADTVSTGEEAIEAAEVLSPELILMDVQLRDEIDGIEAMNQIRKKSDVPVIYISGNTDVYNLRRARQTHFIEYMVKPIRMEDLELAIDKALQNDNGNGTSNSNGNGRAG